MGDGAMIRQAFILVLIAGLAVVAALVATVEDDASRPPANPHANATHNHHEHDEQPNNAVSPRYSSDRHGAPTRGQDPAMQRQASLVSAASQPQGSGQRTDTPAAGVMGTHRRINPASVLPDLQKTGVLAGGCLVSYGTPGAQCLPARAPGNQLLTCSYVRTLFPNGIAVKGSDRLQLDDNEDGIACGAGDLGLPAW